MFFSGALNLRCPELGNSGLGREGRGPTAGQADRICFAAKIQENETRDLVTSRRLQTSLLRTWEKLGLGRAEVRLYNLVNGP